MKTGTSSLSGDTLLQSIRDQFKLVKDHRDKNRISIELLDFLMAGFSIFSLKFTSLLQFEELMREKKYNSHLSPLYKITIVPSDTQMRAVLDEVDPELIAPIFKKLFKNLQRSNHLKEFQYLNGKYILCIDGTQYYCSDKIYCESCMVKKSKSSEPEEANLYYHQMLAGSIVHPDKNSVIPICPEPIKKQDGKDKNDSERTALKRFLDRLRRDHPKLPLILTADALHATGPLIRDLLIYDIDYILAVKPGSHEKLFSGVEKWDERGNLNYYTYEEELGDKIKKKRIHEFRYANKILFNFSDLNTHVNYLEYWETTQWVSPKGELKEEKRHFSWVTSFQIDKNNIVQIMRGGRARWKIENETFNTLKNQGYEFEHNFGHGNKHLSTVFAYLMFLAFLFDQLQQIGCQQFQKLLVNIKRKKYLWEHLRTAFIFSYKLKKTFESWSEFLDFIMVGEENENTS